MKKVQSVAREYRRMSKRELVDRLSGLQDSVSKRSQQSLREIELAKVMQELEIHQIELEMQNRELRESQHTLEASQERYLNLYDFAPVGYVTLTPQGLISEINLTGAAMLGVERHWLIGRSLAPWILGADVRSFREHLHRCEGSSETRVTKLHLLRRDQVQLPVELSSSCYADPATGELQVRSALVSLEDRTKLEDSLRSSVDRLNAERELRELFVSTLTHDLRTPLTAARLNVELLAADSTDPELASKSIGIVLKCVDRIDHMVQDLLDANRIRAGEPLPIQVSRFDLMLLTKDTLDELSIIHGNRFVLQASGQAMGHWCKSALRRLIENLVSNAIKYGFGDCPVVVTVRLNPSKSVTMTVQNSGNPIPKEQQSTLFQQFRRAPFAQNGVQKGWGLGLTLAKGTVEAHGGNISVESSAENGTIFTVVLPLEPKIDAATSRSSSYG